jgi:ubiquinone biosynthesis protein
MLAAQSSPVSGIVFAATVLVTSVALVAGLAWAARRLLGLPVGALRALTAGLLGFVAPTSSAGPCGRPSPGTWRRSSPWRSASR